jgi:hypothetical protein
MAQILLTAHNGRRTYGPLALVSVSYDEKLVTLLGMLPFFRNVFC